MQSAKRLAQFAPSLRKYRRRKTLNRWEKAAIARKENKLKFTDQLFPLTATQSKKLKDKDALVGGGIRAIRLRNTAAGASVRVARNKIEVKSAGRQWFYITIDPPDGDLLAAAAERIYAEGRRRKKVTTIYIWTVQGRANLGSRSERIFVEEIAARMAAYDFDPNAFIIGLAYTFG